MAARVRFGVYELDRDAMELRRHGLLIRLQEQPCRVLAVLAERPGELITREELREKIWPGSSAPMPCSFMATAAGGARDDHWVVFKKTSAVLPPSKILIAPVRHGAAAGPGSWIAETEGRDYADKPQFSADGNTLFFTSTRDGYLCI